MLRSELPPELIDTPVETAQILAFVIVLSCPSISIPTESGLLFPTMFTSRISASEEPLFEPYLICMPTFVFFMEQPRMNVSLPLSIDMPSAFPAPSIIPPDDRDCSSRLS